LIEDALQLPHSLRWATKPILKTAHRAVPFTMIDATKSALTICKNMPLATLRDLKAKLLAEAYA
jgi:hypothetical protein